MQEFIGKEILSSCVRHSSKKIPAILKIDTRIGSMSFSFEGAGGLYDTEKLDFKDIYLTGPAKNQSMIGHTISEIKTTLKLEFSNDDYSKSFGRHRGSIEIKTKEGSGILVTLEYSDPFGRAPAGIRYIKSTSPTIHNNVNYK